MLRSPIKVGGDVLHVILDYLGDAGRVQQLYGRVLANPVRTHQPSDNSYQQSDPCQALPARKQQVSIFFDILNQITSLEREKFDWLFLALTKRAPERGSESLHQAETPRDNISIDIIPVVN